MNSKPKGWLPRRKFLKTIPRKRVTAGAIFLDTKDRVLLVKAWYKDHWTLPGGIVDANESPRQGCLREVREEIGLPMTRADLRLVVYARQPKYKDEVIFFHYYGGRITEAAVKKLRLQKSELTDARLVSLRDIRKYMVAHSATTWPAVLRAIKNKQTLYVES